jgi:zinc transporter ZupT
MTAASFWSLLLPAIEIAQFNFDGNKKLSCMPITLGFLAGALFVFLTDWIMPENVCFFM